MHLEQKARYKKRSKTVIKTLYFISIFLIVSSYSLLQYSTYTKNPNHNCNPFRNPIIERFCKRSSICAPIHQQINQYRKTIYETTTPYNQLLHVQKLIYGAGFGHVIQEQAQILLLGLLEQRPVFFLSQDSNNTFDGDGSIFVANRIPEAYKTYEIKKPSCKNYKGDFPYACMPLQLYTQYKTLDILNDGLVYDFLPKLKEWSRWTHTVSKVFRFHDETFAFVSPSIVAMYIHDFVQHRIRHHQKLYQTTEFSGPRCILNYLLSRPSTEILKQVSDLVSIDKDIILIGLHIRRGDSAIYRECKSCVAEMEPDNHKSDRISMHQVRSGLVCVNDTRHELLQNGIRSEIFVMSDTTEAKHMTKMFFPSSLSIKGKARHTKSSNMNKYHHNKLAQEVYTYMISDVQITIGASSLSGNAASASMSTHIYYHQCDNLKNRLIDSILHR